MRLHPWGLGLQRAVGQLDAFVGVVLGHSPKSLSHRLAEHRGAEELHLVGQMTPEGQD